MIVKAKIGEDGIIKIDDPSLYGKEVDIYVNQEIEELLSGSFNWEKLKEALEDAQSSDFPRRTTEEIMKDIDEMRGRN